MEESTPDPPLGNGGVSRVIKEELVVFTGVKITGPGKRRPVTKVHLSKPLVTVREVSLGPTLFTLLRFVPWGTRTCYLS